MPKELLFITVLLGTPKVHGIVSPETTNQIICVYVPRPKVNWIMLHQSRGLVLVKQLRWNPQCRGMATLKSISLRLKSVKNIQKITQSMKMVSAAKYTRAERELKLARPFGAGAQAFYEKAEVAAPEDEKSPKLIVAMTSDRGLCGAVHSSVGRVIRVRWQNNSFRRT